MRTLLISVGLLHLCGSIFGLECNSALLINWDFAAPDIEILNSPDAEHCQQLCTQHASCLFFAFIGPDCTVDDRHFHCFLKATPSGVPNSQVVKQGTTAGYSLRNCQPDPQPCLSRVYENVDFPGSDYRYFFTPDYQECQRACTSDPSCQFFSFLNGKYANENVRYKCHLKFSWNIPRTPEVVANAQRTSGFSQTILPADNVQTECPTILFPNIDFPGNDIDNQPAASPEQCQTLCSSHPSCTYFSYVSNVFKCYLKNNAASVNPTAVIEITSGFPLRFCKLDKNWIKRVYEGVDFPYSDIRSFPLDSADLCQKSCTEEPLCQFYSYNTISHLCYLKRVITIPAPSRVTKLDHAVSGFTLKNCQV